MARIKDRRKVIELRKIGKTYSEIRRIVHVPKSTLSDWLSKYPLTKEQIFILEKNRKRNKDLSIEKVIQTKRIKREKRLAKTYIDQKKNLLPLSSKEIYLVGLFLYWGEGSKSLKGAVSLSNTDPRVIKFFLFWLKRGLRIPRKKIRVLVHLYEDMDKNGELNYWSKELNIPRVQFTKPYIKKSKRLDIDQKGFGHGTCNVGVCDVRLKEEIIEGIQAISDYYIDRFNNLV